MADLEDQLRTRLRQIADDAPPTRGASTADRAVHRSARRRRRGATAAVAGLLVVGIPVGAALAARGGAPGGVAIAPAVTAVSSAPAAAATTPSAAATSTAATPDPVPGNAFGPSDPQVGVAYPFDLYTHCGIRSAQFGGRTWTVVTPQPDPARLPDRGGVVTYTGYVSGTMLLLTEDRLRFTVTDPNSAADGRSFDFVPVPDGAPRVPLCQ